MVGQGRPNTGRRWFALRIGLAARNRPWLAGAAPRALSALPLVAIALGAAALIALESTLLPLAAQAQTGPALSGDPLPIEPSTVQSVAAESTMTIRVCWGGGSERQWRGTVSISSGSLSIVRPLGIIADSPGSIWSSSERQIEIRERSPRSYDGVDIAIAAPLDARLSISLAPDADPRPTTSDVALSEVVAKMHRRQLDGGGNQLLVRRSPGDSIRLTTDNDPLIFAPGELWKLTLKPRLLPVSAGTTVYFKARLVAPRGSAESWSQELTAKSTETETEPASLPLDVKLPDAEGVYDLVIEASERGPLRWPKPVVERRVQVIVLSPNPTPTSVIAGAAGAKAPDHSLLNGGDAQNWTQVLEIDPTNPHWYDRLKSLRLSMLITVPLGKESSPGWQGPLGSGNSQIIQHPLGKVVQLSAAAKGADASWESYPLAIAKPGTPHILEVEYPSDVPQTLGISIVEPNAAGSVAPIGLDSGFDVSEPSDGTAPRWLKHRLVFWPRTSSPFLLLVNRRDGSRAVYGKLRLYSSGPWLRRAFAVEDQSQRLLAGYLDRPLFTANFSAGEALDTFTGRSLTDWQTFHEGATRLADYLNATGRNALMMAVLAEGSTIYPSKLLQPTPRFDSGAFLDLGQDPTRKDVLEMMLRVFDREQLKMIPMLQFSAPLPELEALLREGGPSDVGLQWVGRDGAAWTDVTESRHDMAPYYNVLDPRVQDAMLRVIHELVDRCASHQAFAGIAIELSADGFAQLPGEAWGLDDRTIARFEQEAGVSIPATGAGRFAERARFVTGPGRRAWLLWRSGALADFYRRVEQELVATRRDARLYLVPTKPFDLPEIERELRPSLPPRGRIDEALLAVGIRPDAYRNEPGIVLLRSQRFSPTARLAAQAIDIETNRSSDWDAVILAQPSPAALFYHEPQRCRVASFDAKSPFGKDKTYTWLISQITPSQQDNRRRFVHSLATLDSQAMFDGGWLLPLGQEPALDNVTAAFRQLPARRFETLADCVEPLTVRSLHTGGQTYAYLVNDSPWPVRASLRVEAPSGVRPEELGGQHRADAKGTAISVDLEAYDLAVVRFPSEEVRLSSPQVFFAPQAARSLEAMIREFHNRRVLLESPPPVTLLSNPGFELPPARSGQVPGWKWNVGPTDHVSLDSKAPHGGRQSLHLQAGGQILSLRSEAFPAPETGRLAISVWLKGLSDGNQPQVRLVLQGMGSRPWGKEGLVSVPNEWKPFVFPIDDLPTDAGAQLRFRIDLLGPGDVWVDDIEMNDLMFTDTEKTQLSTIIARADFQLKSGRLGDCLDELDGYWARLLTARSTPASSPLIVPAEPGAAKEAPDKNAARPGMLDRIKDAWRR
jgi:hypothetical protein